MRFDGHVEDFARKVEAVQPRTDELLHVQEQVTQLQSDLASGQPEAPIYIEQIYQCRVVEVDRDTFRCSVDANTPEGLIRGVRYGRNHPRVDEEYALHIPTTGTEPWIEVPSQEEDWLYYMGTSTDDGRLMVVRTPWPPVDEHPSIEIVINEVEDGYRLVGVSGAGSVWLFNGFAGETGLLRRYTNYGFDDNPVDVVFPFGGSGSVAMVDNSPNSDHILAVTGAGFGDRVNDTWEGAPNADGYGGSGSSLQFAHSSYLIGEHGFFWPPTGGMEGAPWWIHTHSPLPKPVFGGFYSIPGAHPPEHPCCGDPTVNGGLNSFGQFDHRHDDFDVMVLVTWSPTWVNWPETENHIHWVQMPPRTASGGGNYGLEQNGAAVQTITYPIVLHYNRTQYWVYGYPDELWHMEMEVSDRQLPIMRSMCTNGKAPGLYGPVTTPYSQSPIHRVPPLGGGVNSGGVPVMTMLNALRCGGGCMPGATPGPDGYGNGQIGPDPATDVTRYCETRMVNAAQEEEPMVFPRIWLREDEQIYGIPKRVWSDRDRAHGTLSWSNSQGYTVHASQSSDFSASQMVFPRTPLAVYPATSRPIQLMGIGPTNGYADGSRAISAIALWSDSNSPYDDFDQDHLQVYVTEAMEDGWEPFTDFTFNRQIDQTWQMKHILAQSSDPETGETVYWYTTNGPRGDWQQAAWKDYPSNDQVDASFHGGHYIVILSES